MDQSLELSAAQIQEVTTFVNSTEVLDNPNWLNLVEQLRVSLDTTKGKNFITTALEKLTIEVDPDDMQINVEFLAASMSMGFTKSEVLCPQVKAYNSLRNKKKLQDLFLSITEFNTQLQPDSAEIAVPVDHQQQLGEICASMSACTTAMTQMMETVLKKIPTKSPVHDVDHTDESDEEESYHEDAAHLKTIRLWREGVLTRVELAKVIESYSYSLAPFIKRSASSVAKAMLMLKDARRLLDPEQYSAIMLLLSTAVRDVEEEILEPGGRPSVQANHALAMSLLGSRYSRTQLATKLQRKPNKQPYVPPSSQPGKKDDKKPQWKPKKPYAKPSGSASHGDAEDKSD